MLKAKYYTAPTDIDLVVFDKLPQDHSLRRLKAVIDLEPLRALGADCYAPGGGAPAAEPVRMLKLSLRQFQYDLSESQVVRQAQGNRGVRFFLDLSGASALPGASLLAQFRTRLGTERFERVFKEILCQARAGGLGKDRLRLKDATQLITRGEYGGRLGAELRAGRPPRQRR